MLGSPVQLRPCPPLQAKADRTLPRTCPRWAAQLLSESWCTCTKTIPGACDAETQGGSSAQARDGAAARRRRPTRARLRCHARGGGCCSSGADRGRPRRAGGSVIDEASCRSFDRRPDRTVTRSTGSAHDIEPRAQESVMQGTVLHGPRDIRFETVEDARIVKPTDAVVRLAATCVCGSDLWPYRGLQPIDGPTPMGHEYCGYVEEVGSAVTSVSRGSSSSARSPRRTTPARTATTATRRPARSASSSRGRRLRRCACRWRMARWCRRPACLRRT